MCAQKINPKKPRTNVYLAIMDENLGFIGTKKPYEPGANPTIVSYNSMSGLVCLENKDIVFYILCKTL
jgi:hypothetical protein